MNPISIVTELRNKHNEGMATGGINVKNGTISDMWAEKIVQPLLVNTSEITLASECVGMILKIGEFSSVIIIFRYLTIFYSSQMIWCQSVKVMIGRRGRSLLHLYSFVEP